MWFFFFIYRNFSIAVSAIFRDARSLAGKTAATGVSPKRRFTGKQQDNDIRGTSRDLLAVWFTRRACNGGLSRASSNLQLPARFGRDKAARLHVTHHREWMHGTIMDVYEARGVLSPVFARRAACVYRSQCADLWRPRWFPRDRASIRRSKSVLDDTRKSHRKLHAT